MNDLNRRDFLKVTGTAAAVLGISEFPTRLLAGVDEIDNPLGVYPNRNWEEVYRDQYRTWATSDCRSSSLRCANGNMADPGMPRVITCMRSASDGTRFFVVTSRNLPSRKFRGLGNRNRAAGPLPSPFSPWQAAQ